MYRPCSCMQQVSEYVHRTFEWSYFRDEPHKGAATGAKGELQCVCVFTLSSQLMKHALNVAELFVVRGISREVPSAPLDLGVEARCSWRHPMNGGHVPHVRYSSQL